MKLHPTNLPRIALQNLEKAQERLHAMKRLRKTWQAVADDLGVSLGSVCRVAGGYYPRSLELCQKFDLPYLVPAPICPVHGKACSIIHRSDKRKPRTNWKALSLLLIGLLVSHRDYNP